MQILFDYQKHLDSAKNLIYSIMNSNYNSKINIKFKKYHIKLHITSTVTPEKESIKKITINDLVSKDVTVKESKTIEIIRPRKL